MTGHAIHRLDGFEPDNLLAFMALLGLLRVLEEARPGWRPRVFWTVDEPPLRPALRVPLGADLTTVVEAAAEGLNALAECHNFDGLVNLKLPPERARERLQYAAANAPRDRYTADLWAAFVSDVVIEKERTRTTPLCLLGTGQTSFLKTFKSVPLRRTPPKRGPRGSKTEVSEYECLSEALFRTWERPDKTDGQDKTSAFRWDPSEDARHALRWSAPTDDKEPTQHGANRLAAIGLSVLTVVPRMRHGETELSILGGERGSDRRFTFGWPIWREPVSLAGIRALLGHPHLDRQETRAVLGIVERRRARRISVGKYMNMTRAETVPEES